MFLFVSLGLTSCGDDEPEPTVTSITTSQSVFNVTPNETFTINVSHQPSSLSAPQYSWSIQPSGIVNHLGDGKFLAISVGEAEITISIPNTNISTKCKVIVSEVPISQITLSQSSISLVKKQTVQLTATISPENATYKELSWNTSDGNVATVDNNGNVTARAVGNCKITVSSKDGKVSASCDVEVTPILVSAITLSSTNMSLIEGETAELLATITPEDADDKSLSWQSDNPSIASVNSDGKITAKKAGSATITCSSASSNVEAKCTISVSEISSYVTSYLSTGWTSVVSSTGMYQGYFAKCKITNNSNVPIQVTSYKVMNGSSVVKEGALSKTVQGKQNHEIEFYTYNTSWSNYKLIWTYKYNGKDYTVSNY